MRNILFFLLSFPIALTAQRDTNIIKPLDELVCLGLPCPTAVKNSIHSVKVITEKTIAKRGVNNLEELLMSETNIRFKTDVLIGSGVQIGGIGGENVKVLIDGVPVIGRMNGNVDLAQIPLYNVEKIEIVQGSLSTLYGSNASGGVINIVTRKSQLKTGEIKAVSFLETINPYKTRTDKEDITRKTKIFNPSINIQNHTLNAGFRYKKLFVQAGGAMYDFIGYSEDTTRSIVWNPKKQLSATTSAKYYLNNEQTLSAGYSFFDENIQNLGDVKLGNKPKLSYANDESYHTKRSDINLNYQGTWQKFSLQNTFAYNDFNRLKEAYKLNFFRNEKQLLEESLDTSSFRSFLTRHVAVYQPNKKFNFQGGIETNYETAISGRIVDVNEEKEHFAAIGDYAVFASAKIQPFDKQLLTIQPSLRASYNTKYNAPLTPAIHLLYQPISNWSIRASYANGFRAPSLKELYFNFVDSNHDVVGNQDILAERSNNFIVAPTYQVECGKHSFNVESQFFYNHIKNKITLTQINPPDIRYTYFNVGNFQTKGVNLSLMYQFNNQLTIKATAAYTGFFNELRELTDSIPTYNFSPETSLEITYSIPHTGLTINVLHRYIGAVPTFSNDVISDEINEGKIPDYQMLNATLSRNFWNDNITFTLGGKNLLNVQSLNITGNSNAGHSGTGRSQEINFGRSFFVRMAVNLKTRS